MKIALVSFSHLPVYKNALFTQCKALEKELPGCVFCICAKDVICNASFYDRRIELTVPKSPKPSFLSAKLYQQSKRIVIDYLRKNHIDVVYFLSKHIWNYFLIQSLMRKGIKIIHAIHDPIGHSGERIAKGVYLYNKLISKKIDAAVLFSNTSYRCYLEHFPPKENVAKMSYIQFELMDYKKKTIKEKNVLFFGRLNPYKGIEFLPSLADELLKLDNEIKLFVVGKKDKNLKQEILDDLESRQNVVLINRFVDDREIDYLFEKASICILPYRSITQSGVIIDSYIRSTPICAFNIEGISEFVDCENGIIIEPYDIGSMAHALFTFLNSDEEINKKSFLSWKKGNELFSPSSWAITFKSFVEKILKTNE